MALIMPSRPEYIATWLGLSSVGVVVALLNTQLRGHSLLHCVDVVKPQHVIVSSEFLRNLAPLQRISRVLRKSGHTKLDLALSIAWLSSFQQGRSCPTNGPSCPSEIVPFLFIHRAQRACRRRRMSAITACCNGVFGLQV